MVVGAQPRAAVRTRRARQLTTMLARRAGRACVGVYSTNCSRNTRLQNAAPFGTGLRSGSSTRSLMALTWSLTKRFSVQFTPSVRTSSPLGRMCSARGLRNADALTCAAEPQPFVAGGHFDGADPAAEQISGRLDRTRLLFAGHDPGARDVPGLRQRIGQVLVANALLQTLIDDVGVFAAGRHRAPGPIDVAFPALPPALDVDRARKTCPASSPSGREGHWEGTSRRTMR